MKSPLVIGVAKDVYPSLMGSLPYAAVCTRPDVSTALNIIGFAQANPMDTYFHALKKVVRYLQGITTCAWRWGGVRTTTPNLHASRMQIGLMAAVRASNVHATCLHSVKAM
jgi:hypothetical protein